jgi:hypothetical protein
MGPQSVVFTWSESGDRDTDGEDADDEAEAMVLCPELVVYPYVPTPPSSPPSSSDEDEDQKNISPWSNEAKTRRAKRRRRKLAKSKPAVLFETRTIVLGAVLVLGVSMAVYGIRATGHGGAAGARGSWSWKKVGGWVGGVLVGASERIVEGFGLF